MAEKLSAEQFRNGFMAAWKERWSSDLEGLEKQYSSTTGWTQLMLKDECLLADVCRRLSTSERPLVYRTEWAKFDALFAQGKALGGDEVMDGYPIHALIEHENADHLETEMWRLIHWRCPLKVLIFYDWNVDGRTTDNRKGWLQWRMKHLREMLRRANAFCPESSATEYLFIVGHRDDRQCIQWRWATNATLDSGSGDIQFYEMTS